MFKYYVTFCDVRFVAPIDYYFYQTDALLDNETQIRKLVFEIASGRDKYCKESNIVILNWKRLD